MASLSLNVTFPHDAGQSMKDGFGLGEYKDIKLKFLQGSKVIKKPSHPFSFATKLLGANEVEGSWHGQSTCYWSLDNNAFWQFVGYKLTNLRLLFEKITSKNHVI